MVANYYDLYSAIEIRRRNAQFTNATSNFHVSTLTSLDEIVRKNNSIPLPHREGCRHVFAMCVSIPTRTNDPIRCLVKICVLIIGCVFKFQYT